MPNRSRYATEAANDDEEDEGAPFLSRNQSYGQNNQSSSVMKQIQHNPVLGLVGLVIALLATFMLAYWLGSSGGSSSRIGGASYTSTHQPITPQAIRYGWNQCQAIDKKNEQRTKYFEGLATGQTLNKKNRTTNPRFDQGDKYPPIVIRSITVWDGLGNQFVSDVILRQGIIVEMGRYLHIPKGATIIQGKGKILTPGIIDMHSHIGVDSWPALKGSDDTNEMTQPTYPQLKTLDGFNPSDLAIPRVVSGGVTTVLVLPGSGNLMGGEAFTFKLRTLGNLSVEHSMVQAGINEGEEFKWRYMKFACGENPKRVYGSMNRSPSTRMGSGYLMRKLFSQASKLVRQQDAWCDYMTSTYSSYELKSGKAAGVAQEFPSDIQLESLSQVVRGNVQPHIHCYETEDLEMLVRLSEEYEFQIWAFHHALEAYRVPELVKRAGRNGFNVTIATFADGWGYKKEAYLGIPQAPLILARNDIPVAFKSDHPVINSQQLMFEATKAFHEGLSPQLALASLTSVPAKALGLHHRIGSIKVGMDADLVIWDKDPLSVGARPHQVFIDGIPMIKSDQADDGDDDEGDDSITSNHEKFSQPSTSSDAKKSQGEKSCPPAANHNGLIIDGLAKIIVNRSTVYDIKSLSAASLKIQLDSRGNLVCIGADCSTSSGDQAPDQLNLNIDSLGDKDDPPAQAWMIPGLIASNTKLGLNEIAQESSTGDGEIEGEVGLEDEALFLLAKDGLTFGGKHLDRAYHGGITTAITSPQVTQGIMAGFSVTFATDGATSLKNQDVVAPVTALHINLGADYLTSTTPSVSMQLAKIRKLLNQVVDKRGPELVKDNSPMAKVLKGELPLVVRVDQADQITHLIQLRNEVRRHYKLNGGVGSGLHMVLVGGAESWMVADQLADEQVPIVLQPARCVPDTWERRRCLPGPPLSHHTTLTALHQAGVQVGLAPDADGEYARDLLWEASWAHADAKGNLTEVDAIGLVTWNIEDMFLLNKRDKEVQAAGTGFLIYNGDPLLSTTKLTHAWTPNRGLTCF